MMLVLSRKIGETIRIGSEVELVVLKVERGRVKLGFAGPRDVAVRRGELEDSQGATDAVAAVREAPARSTTSARSATAPLRTFRQHVVD